MIAGTDIVGTHDVLFCTLDTLRFDVAQSLFTQGKLPNLSKYLPASGWELRHSPGSFTYASHHAFFAGFLPTPATPGKHDRLFALRFDGSTTTGRGTHVFDGSTIVEGFAQAGYHTICIGGVGFFNKQNPLGCVLPGLFQQSYWSREMGVTDPESTKHQVALATRILRETPASERVFLFLNVSALHQPNRFYLPGAQGDSIESHAAAMCYVDSQLGALFDAFSRRNSTFCIVCSDHGTAYGDQGFTGHRNAQPCVYNVPYAEFVLPHLPGTL